MKWILSVVLIILFGIWQYKQYKKYKKWKIELDNLDNIELGFIDEDDNVTMLEDSEKMFKNERITYTVKHDFKGKIVSEEEFYKGNSKCDGCGIDIDKDCKSKVKGVRGGFCCDCLMERL